MTTIRVALVGAGHWHALQDASYLSHLASMEGVRLVAIHDDDMSIARLRADEVGGVPAYGDLDQLISRERPDFVVALGRHDRMPTVAEHLVDRGVPFLMEKPLGRNSADVAALAEKARAKGVFVSVPLAQRYLPSAMHARQMMARGEFGDLSHFSYRFIKGTPARYVAWGSPWMLDPEASGGGCLRNFGVHGFDLFRYLTGREPRVVGATVSRAVHGLGIEDHAVALAHSMPDLSGAIEVGYTLPIGGRDFELRLSGSRASLTARMGEIEVVTEDGVKRHAEPTVEAPHRRVLRESLESWRAGNEPPITVDDCLAAVRLVDAAYRLARGENAG